MKPPATPRSTARPNVLPPASPRGGPGGGWVWAALTFGLCVLAGMLWPCFACIQVKGAQTKALAQAKQVGLWLKLFAMDHEGNYPRQGVPREMRNAPTNANLAFACLFPRYTTTEIPFGNRQSAYQSGTGLDNRIDDPYTGRPVETLRAGENVYGYMLGLTEEAAPETPLVMDGTDGTGHYSRDPRARGGVWRGQKAVVIRLDNSGAVETLKPTGPGQPPGVYDARQRNELEPGRWGKDVQLLDPEITHP